jgi:anti-anti-sigma regulatory factor
MAAPRPSDLTHRLNLTEVDGYLIVNLPPVLTDQLLFDYNAQIRHLVAEWRYQGVIINLTAVSLLDYSSLLQIRKICQANTLLGSGSALLGINPSIAAYLAEMPDAFADLAFCNDMASAKHICG